jgi:succinate-acetate transporter protein
MANVRATPPATPISPAPISAPAVATAVADPNPLGLSALALTWFFFSLVNVGAVPAGGGAKVVLAVALVYGGLTLLLAGMWEFRAGNTLGATAAASFGAFWLSYVVLLTPGLFGISNTAIEYKPLGVYLLGWAIVTAILAIASLRTTVAFAATLVLLFLTFLLLGVAQFTDNDALTAVGGWLGILTALVAWYTALAALLRTASRGAIALPVYPLA